MPHETTAAEPGADPAGGKRRTRAPRFRKFSFWTSIWKVQFHDRSSALDPASPAGLEAGAHRLAHGRAQVGKTVLAKALPDAEFLNCDLPSSAERLHDPEAFLRSVATPLVVLDTLRAIPAAKIQFWRNKQQRETDFAVPRNRGAVDAQQCKWNLDAFEPLSLQAFRENHPAGRNYLIAPGVQHRSSRRVGGLELVLLPIAELPREISVR